MNVCHRGDTYFVPAGVPHTTWVEPGTRGLDIFEEHDRYLPAERTVLRVYPMEMRYGGPREGRERARMGVFKNGVRTALGLGRGPRAKILPWTFIVLLTIPIGLIGVAWALILHGKPASFMALLGVVALAATSGLAPL